MQELFYLAIILVAGLIFGEIAALAKVPRVTGYLLAGLIIGPSVLGIVPLHYVESLSFISSIALAFIAFAIGCEFKVSYFKKAGVTPFVIAIAQALLAVALVVGALIAFGYETPFALVLGSIAAATAPATTIMVIKQYNAEGPTTQTLLSVVGIGDAIALLTFNICVAVAQAMINPNAGSILSQLKAPLVEIVSSIVVGAVLGAALIAFLKFIKKRTSRESIIYAVIFIACYLAKAMHLSDLLTCMAIGAVIANFCSEEHEVVTICDLLNPPIYLAFFVLSGADLNLSVLPSIGLVGVIYVLVRCIGKVAGAFIGAKVCGASESIQKYLGFALIPQAGMAIGLTVIAKDVLPSHAESIRAVILCAILIYEFVGPSLSKWALKKAGEIAQDQ